ncbi:hypothetical protein M8J76_008233 [Diaphorina citri]|nr:hypothetical protein M8J76_008233 [Diaphorina citri]
MPRQGGASVNKRRLLNNVVESTILYASPVWDRCMFCEEADTAEHTFFSCSKWTMYRAEMEREIGQQLTVGNLCNEMLKSERNWEAIARCMNRIMKDKEAEERRRKEQNSTTNR